MRVLLIEDDAKIQAFVSKGLQQEQHTVDIATTGDEGLAHWQSHHYDAVILDLMLPGINGIKILKKMRSLGDKTPVLILSAKSSVDERVLGLDAGADDYLIKPFVYAELSARIQAITRRNHPSSQSGSNITAIELNGLRIDLLTRSVVRDNKKIDLLPREFSLLELLMRNPDRPLPKSLILERIWGYTFDPQTNIVDVLICRLRNKIDGEHSVKLIRTIRGVGYVFRTDT